MREDTSESPFIHHDHVSCEDVHKRVHSMLKVLRWIERTNWRMVVAGSVFGLSVFSLVLAEVNQLEGTGLLVHQGLLQGQGERHDSHMTVAQSKRHPVYPQNTEQGRRENPRDEIYLYLDLRHNILVVMKGDRKLRTALVATGSGKVLQDPHDPARRWRFTTPKGQHVISSKLKKPVWVRPDWAFIEKRVPIPSERKDRLLPGALGNYALGFGNGYFLHGGAPTSLLGFNVTHGCIQLNDEDLHFIFETVPLGAQLVIV